jgi:predicted metal-dependent HD superfamily phosphohydrolase
MTMRERWAALLAPFSAQPAAIEDAFVLLQTSHAEPQRHYHNLAHIEAVLDVLGRLVSPSPALSLAAWLHDTVYDPKRNDNEEQSAALARSLLPQLRVPPEIVEEAARLILLTKTHQADEADVEGKALLDADLSILAAPQVEYDLYAAAIRREYAWVPEADYRAGRAGILERFLTRQRIYHSPAMDEDTARRNLAREIAALR